MKSFLVVASLALGEFGALAAARADDATVAFDWFEYTGRDATFAEPLPAGQGWTALRENDDGSILSSEVAGGFVGTVLGPFVRQE